MTGGGTIQLSITPTVKLESPHPFDSPSETGTWFYEQSQLEATSLTLALSEPLRTTYTLWLILLLILAADVGVCKMFGSHHRNKNWACSSCESSTCNPLPPPTVMPIPFMVCLHYIR